MVTVQVGVETVVLQEVSESKQGEESVHREGQLSAGYQTSSRTKRLSRQIVHRLKLWQKVLELKKSKRSLWGVGRWESGLKWRVRARVGREGHHKEEGMVELEDWLNTIGGFVK